MKMLKKLSAVLIAAVILLAAPVFAVQQSALAAGGKWVAAWGGSIVDGNMKLAGVKMPNIIPAKSTVRIQLKLSVGGEKLRFRLDNTFGRSDVKISCASAARTASGKGAVDASTAVPLTFNGSESVILPAGGAVWSDAVKFKSHTGDAVTLSLYFESAASGFPFAVSGASAYLSVRPFSQDKPSEQVSAPSLSSPVELKLNTGDFTYSIIPFLAQADVYASSNSCAAVFIGDSALCSGAPSYFLQRLNAAGKKSISVINAAIPENKLLSGGSGPLGGLSGDALVQRFERDALSLSGVKYIFVKTGFSDILHQFSPSLAQSVQKTSAAELTNGMKQLVKAAHAKGIKIYFFTNTPFNGCERTVFGRSEKIEWNKTIQKMSDELDAFIKTKGSADGFIDCSALENPAVKHAFCPSFTTNGVNLTDSGAIALADLIPLSFVGFSSAKAKTAAELNGVDVYAEKNKIIYDMKHPTTTAKGGEEPTEKPTGPNVPVIVPAAEETSSSAEIIPVIERETTLPDAGTTLPAPDYDIDDDRPTSIGSGVNIGFLLLLFAVVVIAVPVMLFATGSKSNEHY